MPFRCEYVFNFEIILFLFFRLLAYTQLNIYFDVIVFDRIERIIFLVFIQTIKLNIKYVFKMELHGQLIL